MEIEIIDINKIKPYENNAKLHPPEQIEQIKKSIIEFGNNDPIAIDENNIIIEGHGRYMALKELGYKEAQCIRLNHLNDEQKRAYMLAHNKLTMNTDFDFKILEEEINSIINFDMSDFGFDDININNDITSEIIEDKIPEPPKEAKAKYGDIYKLGNHRLMCGDATKKEDIDKLINNETVDMVFTDPPYNMYMLGAGCFKKSTNNIKKRIQDIIDFDPQTIAFITNLEIHSFYIFTSKDLIAKYLDIFKDYHFNILCWCKTNPVPFTNNTFLPNIEYLLYFHKKGRIWNNSLKPAEIYTKWYITEKLQGRKDANNEDLHPTMKPLNIITDKIQISSSENGIVLDLFGGSGSTLIACEQTNRRCYMTELEPLYVDVIIERYEKFTGDKAIKIN